MNGFLIVDKPAGYTSNDVIMTIKKQLSLKNIKIGHTGTLDKFATGLLIVLIGKFTKLTSIFNDFEKCYFAKIRLGLETDTLDPYGDITTKSDLPSKELFLEALNKHIGTIEQVPPLYSAVKIRGKRASDRLRRGENVSLSPKKVSIFSAALEEWTPPYASIRITCSSGTYIRALARDIAKTAGSCAYLEDLRREAIGPVDVKNAVVPNLVTEQNIMDINTFLRLYPGIFKTLYIKTGAEDKVKNGIINKSILDTDIYQNSSYALFSDRNELLSFVRYNDGRFSFICNM